MEDEDWGTKWIRCQEDRRQSHSGHNKDARSAEGPTMSTQHASWEHTACPPLPTLLQATL